MSEATPPNPRQGRRFQPFFVAACIDARGDASFERIADLAGVTSESIRRFENGVTWPNKNLEAFAAAYAHQGQLGDPRNLFSRSLDWWLDHGRPPLLASEAKDTADAEDPTPQAIVRLIRRAAQPSQGRARAEERPTSTRKTRASGE